MPLPSLVRMPSNVVSNSPENVPRLSSKKMPFVLDDQARKGVMKQDRAIG